MRMPRVRTRTLLALVVLVGLALGIYQAGYRAANPRLMSIIFAPNPSITPGLEADYVRMDFDANDPASAAKARDLQARLTADRISFKVREEK